MTLSAEGSTPLQSELIESLLSDFFQRPAIETVRSYRIDLDSFRAYVGVATSVEAVGLLLGVPHSQANLIVLHYIHLLQSAGMKPSTVNRKVSTLRSLVKLAQKKGLVAWRLEINNLKIGRDRESSWPARSELEKILERSRQQTHPGKAARDYAILRLIHDLALKRGAIVLLNRSDIDIDNARMTVAMTGPSRTVTLSLPKRTVQALRDWIRHRGDQAGPLFINFDHAGKGRRLSGTSIYRVIRDLGNPIGVATGPHGFRQSVLSVMRPQTKTFGVSWKGFRPLGTQALKRSTEQ